MGSVISNHRFSRKSLALFGVFLAYFIGGVAFFYFGFQPAISADRAYARESETANGSLEIPAISLASPVMSVSLNGSDLEVPEQIAGSYSVHANKTLLIGHSSTVFKDLKNLQPGQEIIYNDHIYTVANLETKEKSTISMKEILKEEPLDTIVLMTCAGTQISGHDYSHRLIITATISD